MCQRQKANLCEILRKTLSFENANGILRIDEKSQPFQKWDTHTHTQKSNSNADFPWVFKRIAILPTERYLIKLKQWRLKWRIMCWNANFTFVPRILQCEKNESLWIEKQPNAKTHSRLVIFANKAERKTVNWNTFHLVFVWYIFQWYAFDTR